jgi:hypothetical protein
MDRFESGFAIWLITKSSIREKDERTDRDCRVAFTEKEISWEGVL